MKTTKISNPLTIIGIFAGLAEVAGTVVLPFVDGDLQKIFIWYVIGFPVMLVVLFFVTLNWNHKVLYAPSDFKEDKSWLATMGINKEIEVVKTNLVNEIAAQGNVEKDEVEKVVDKNFHLITKILNRETPLLDSYSETKRQKIIFKVKSYIDEYSNELALTKTKVSEIAMRLNLSENEVFDVLIDIQDTNIFVERGIVYYSGRPSVIATFG